MTKITVEIPDSLDSRICEMWNTLVRSTNIEIPKRQLALWALEQFAQSGVQRSCGYLTDVPVPGDENVMKVTVDIPEQLLNRIEEMWNSFIGSTNIGLPKRKLVLWALVWFARFSD